MCKFAMTDESSKRWVGPFQIHIRHVDLTKACSAEETSPFCKEPDPSGTAATYNCSAGLSYKGPVSDLCAAASKLKS